MRQHDGDGYGNKPCPHTTEARSLRLWLGNICHRHPSACPPSQVLVVLFPKIPAPSFGVSSGFHLKGLCLPMAPSSPLIGHSDGDQWLFCLHSPPGGLTGAGQVYWASWITTRTYSLTYIGGKTCSPLSMTLIPAQYHSGKGRGKKQWGNEGGRDICL